MHISFGNKKLAKKVAIFNLPAIITCPGRTDLCNRICYANKPYVLYSKNVQFSRQNNLWVSLQKDFAGRITAFIRRKGVKLVRIHESGDFYSQKYLNKWIIIALCNPGTLFLAYTRSRYLNFTHAPDNLLLRFSTDKTGFPIEKDGKMYTYMLDTGESLPPYLVGGHICNNQAAHRHYCGESCLFCWTKGVTQNVIWARH